MRKKCFWSIVIVCISLASSFAAEDSDSFGGIVDTQEESAQGVKGYTAVTEPLVVYDKNGNGYLEPEESREYLREKYRLIQENGETGVDSDLLQQYDADGNGTIDAREAGQIREDMEF